LKNIPNTWKPVVENLNHALQEQGVSKITPEEFNFLVEQCSNNAPPLTEREGSQLTYFTYFKSQDDIAAC
jgi:hypothetical protein